MSQNHQLHVDAAEGRPPILAISLGTELRTAEVRALADEVRAQVEAFAGNPFTLLIDTRAVTGAEPDATVAMQELENDLAARGLLKLAHVVKNPDVGARLEAAYAAMGVPNLIGTFVEPDAARTFLSAARVDA